MVSSFSSKTSRLCWSWRKITSISPSLLTSQNQMHGINKRKSLPFLSKGQQQCYHHGSNLILMQSSTTTISTDDKEGTINNEETNINDNNYNNTYYNKQKRVRFRQHVNPLARKFQMPIELNSNWVEQTYANPKLPLFLDIGCATGKFLLQLANDEINNNNNNTKTDSREYNYLGLEIRDSVVEYALSTIPNHLLGKTHFLSCNANVNLDRILNDYAQAYNYGNDDNNQNVVQKIPLHEVCIQFPDPHFKNRHKKRRVVTSSLLEIIAKYMIKNGTIFLQSDVKDVIQEMRMTIREEGNLLFDDVMHDDIEYYDFENLYKIPTEREISVLKRDLPVYRSIFKRK